MKTNEILNNMFENPLINITFLIIFIIAGFALYKYPQKKNQSNFMVIEQQVQWKIKKMGFAQNILLKK
jgi:hypothetical protein